MNWKTNRSKIRSRSTHSPIKSNGARGSLRIAARRSATSARRQPPSSNAYSRSDEPSAKHSTDACVQQNQTRRRQQCRSLSLCRGIAAERLTVLVKKWHAEIKQWLVNGGSVLGDKLVELPFPVLVGWPNAHRYAIDEVRPTGVFQ